MLQNELDSRGYQYHVVNAGIGGDTTSGGVARMQSGIDLHPEFVILELGGNDGLRGLPMDSMQSNLEELILGFQKGGARVILGSRVGAIPPAGGAPRLRRGECDLRSLDCWLA